MEQDFDHTMAAESYQKANECHEMEPAFIFQRHPDGSNQPWPAFPELADVPFNNCADAQHSSSPSGYAPLGNLHPFSPPDLPGYAAQSACKNDQGGHSNQDGTCSGATSPSAPHLKLCMPNQLPGQDYASCEFVPADTHMLGAFSQPMDSLAFSSPVFDDSFVPDGSPSVEFQTTGPDVPGYMDAWNDNSLSPDCSIAESQPMSVTSSRYGCSPHSHLPQMDTPISTAGLDDPKWTLSGLERTDSSFATMERPDPLSLPPSHFGFHQRSAGVDPMHNLVSPGTWPGSQVETTEQPFNSIPMPYPVFSRRCSDGESTSNARSDIRYRAVTRKDGLYHCPFEDQGCSHAPEKLKCNYDKHLDSHLKPYRCDREACNNVRFSSTACLLRHEREAHALHGHGKKPFSCHFAGCDRAQPDKGFPRQWNLRDHMKRVHGYVIPENPTSKNGYPSPPNSPDEASSSRRKKSPDAPAKPSGTKKSKAAGASNKSRRDSHHSQDVLKAHLDKSFAKLNPKELARLQRCHDEGRDIFKEVINMEVC